MALLASISVVVPTYREAENIPYVIERLAKLREAENADLELIFVDDDSQDGSVEAVHACGHDWVRIIVRTENRGLSSAVIEGFRAAKNPVLVCMDCDLSHPPEQIPNLILGLEAGQQMMLGSRYVSGGSTDDDWGFFRWLNSRIATILARPLTNVRDPMSGFFAIRRSTFLGASNLNPVGYKIALELIAKCGIENVGEVPIRFTDRVRGQSKLTFSEQLKYLQHVRRLYIHKFGASMELLQFLAVGASGVAVNLSILTIASFLGAPDWGALAAGIGVSVITNFLLNRQFTFGHARQRNAWNQFGGFVGASALGMVVNYTVAWQVHGLLQGAGSRSLQLSALAGVVAGTAFNFLGNRYVVFRKRSIRPISSAESARDDAR